MIRPLAVIIAAIQLSRPQIPEAEAKRYAEALQAEAKARDFDPLTGVAIIHFESYWHPRVISADGEDYGLGQIRARFVAGCRDDVDPVSDPSPACQAAKERLLDGVTNIRRMGALITANRELCQEKLGRVWFHEWLASYQGRNSPKLGRWCVPGDGTWRVVNYRKELIAKLVPPPKVTAKSAKAPPQGDAKSAKARDAKSAKVPPQGDAKSGKAPEPKGAAKSAKVPPQGDAKSAKARDAKRSTKAPGDAKRASKTKRVASR
ncbi:MAG: hypothetical protein KF915_07520 [Polyangiaceae bacterium]|nr:hypothetical protein [Polyangiaceae bacterium]